MNPIKVATVKNALVEPSDKKKNWLRNPLTNGGTQRYLMVSTLTVKTSFSAESTNKNSFVALLCRDHLIIWLEIIWVSKPRSVRGV